jgi:hypothetical protein
VSEEEKFERTDYGKLSEGQSGADFTTAQNDLKVSPQCSHDECTNAVEDPAEPAWVKLMSAVPVAAQIDSLKAAREGTMMLPEGKTIKSMVASIRPQPEADFALDTIRDQWVEFAEEFATIAPKLKEGLSTLSGFWKGTDFDGFEEQTETVLQNCKKVSGDIAGDDGKGGVVKLLDDKQSEIYEQQGGTSCVYPAPKFYMQGTSCGSHQIHIRPPFFKNCEIHKNDEIAKAVELAGFDPTVIDEVQEGRETTYNRWIEYVNANPDYEVDGLKGEELARKKADEYADERLISLGAEGSEQLEEESARVNEEVTERHANVEAHVQEIAPDVRKSEPTTFNDGETDKFDPPELDAGDGGGMPDLEGAGMDGQSPPADLKGLGGSDPNSLNANGLNENGLNSNGLNGPNGGNLPGGVNAAGDLNGLNDENPFSASRDPDDLTGNGANLPGSVNGGNGLDPLNGGHGLGPNAGGLPPSDYSGGNGLNGLDDNPWSSAPDPDDVSGGLAGGGPTSLPPSNIGGTGLGPSSSHLPPAMVTPAPTGTRGITPPRSSGPRKLDSGRTTGLGTGSGTGPRKLDSGRSSGLSGKGLGGSGGGGGTPPGSGGRGGGLGSGAGRGLGGGMGAGAAGAAGAGGRGAGGAGAGHTMAPGVAGGQRPNGEGDKELERQFWIAEDEDVWGGGPEDEEEDPYA